MKINFSKLPSAATLLALVTTVVTLALSQSLITNKTAQLITGLAGIFVPAFLAAAHMIFSGQVAAAQARLEAAQSIAQGHVEAARLTTKPGAHAHAPTVGTATKP